MKINNLNILHHLSCVSKDRYFLIIKNLSNPLIVMLINILIFHQNIYKRYVYCTNYV